MVNLFCPFNKCLLSPQRTPRTCGRRHSLSFCAVCMHSWGSMRAISYNRLMLLLEGTWWRREQKNQCSSLPGIAGDHLGKKLILESRCGRLVGSSQKKKVFGEGSSRTENSRWKVLEARMQPKLTGAHTFCYKNGLESHIEECTKSSNVWL